MILEDFTQKQRSSDPIFFKNNPHQYLIVNISLSFNYIIFEEKSLSNFK